jgi:hypothetical protein
MDNEKESTNNYEYEASSLFDMSVDGVSCPCTNYFQNPATRMDE